MISIISGLESLASQRRRNNWLTVEMKNGAPANYWANREAPHRGVSGGGGVSDQPPETGPGQMLVHGRLLG